MMIVLDSGEARERAGSVVAAGGVVAFRTDTFYGLGADPFNADALRAIKSLKGREDGKPILVVISDAAEAERFIAGRTGLFEHVSGRHWPGPLTLVVKARERVPEELTAGSGTVGVRLPDDEEVRELVRACGGALTATSANLAGEPPARNVTMVARSFPSGLGLIIDGGEARVDRASTVLDVSGDTPRLIREGVVSRRELQETLQSLGVNFRE
ncbi:MAG TPA: L-threonylcarbamoyladenylate synthase [Pyrinomonadaceae bacterium]|jgi:L-threonylcarbamoyladenylate synthase